MENKTFTREEIEQCKYLQNKLYKRCEKICSIFEKYSYKYGLIRHFKFINNELYSWGYSDEDYFVWYIPIYYLFMTDEELQNIVDEKINERNEKERIKQEKNKRAQEEKERQMYEVLKQKYGGTETIGRKPFNIVKRGK